MCHVSLRDKKSSEESQNTLGIVNRTDILHQTRFRWFGHVKRMDKENSVRNCRFIEVAAREGNVDHFKHGSN